MNVHVPTRPTPELVARYDGRAPRYTSYPTAVQLTPEVDAATYRGWLQDLPAEPVSLYVHVPFCSRLCWYCGCNTRAVSRREPIGDYVRYLLRELTLLEAALPGRLAATALHFGGGTPNMLSLDELAAVFAALRGTFALAPDAEIAAELNPGSLTRDWVLTLAAPADGKSKGYVDGEKEVVKDILQNPAAYYVNVHNSTFPGGALRGQLSK